MRLHLSIKDAEGVLPEDRVLAEAAARGLEVLIRRHLRRKVPASSRRAGFPPSGYWASAAETVEAHAAGKTAVAEVGKEGANLHYEGGTIRPTGGKKALAIPIDPSVATIWPSEYAGCSTGGSDDDATAIFWPRGSSHGFIKDTETGDLLWLLVPKATIRADKTVLPSDEDLLGAAEDAILGCIA